VADKEIENELKRKREITLANHVVDEVKIFISALLHYLGLIHREVLTSDEFLKDEIQPDLVKLIVNMLVNEELYRVLILLYRVDNFDGDKDLRSKYTCMKGVKTTDFSIDAYLSLAEPLVVFKEASERFGITIKTTSDMISNPTVQKMDLEDCVNIEFKEYFKKNKEHIEELPGEVQMKLM
jgi:hypothetical protein